MTVREKLVELQINAFNADNISKSQLERIEFTTDFLLANNVTIQEWHPASEHPKENGYYMCVILASAIVDKKEYKRRILFWEENLWLEKPTSFRIEKPLFWMHMPEMPKLPSGLRSGGQDD